jgi:hypothetical protein
MHPPIPPLIQQLINPFLFKPKCDGDIIVFVAFVSDTPYTGITLKMRSTYTVNPFIFMSKIFCLTLLTRTVRWLMFSPPIPAIPVVLFDRAATQHLLNFTPLSSVQTS